MDAGLDNAKALRMELLPPELRTNDKFDTLFASLGKGVLGEMESFLGRKLVRVASDEMIVSANREFVVTERYPIEGTPTVTTKVAQGSTWDAVTIENTLHAAGMIVFGSVVGSERDLLKVVYTGGYWVDTSDNGTGTLPSGTTAVPSALHHAWITQCAHEAEMRRLIGGEMAVMSESGAAVRLGPDKIRGLLAVVRETIRPWQKMAM